MTEEKVTVEITVHPARKSAENSSLAPEVRQVWATLDLADAIREQTAALNRQQQKPARSQTSLDPAEEPPLCKLLADLIAANDPNGKRPKIGAIWAAAEDRMLRLDGRDPAEAERLIRWTQASEFWRGNILSMPKFREKYTQLYQAAVRDTQEKSAPQSPAEARAAEIRRSRGQ